MAVMVLPLVLNPGFWAGVGKAAAFVGSAVAAAVVADAAIDAVGDSADEDTDAPAVPDARQCETCGEDQECPPCVPPVGTVEVERIDRVPPSRAHFPCPGDHAHTRVRRQNPRTCQCFWNKGQVICLSQGGSPTPGQIAGAG